MHSFVIFLLHHCVCVAQIIFNSLDISKSPNLRVVLVHKQINVAFGMFVGEDDQEV